MPTLIDKITMRNASNTSKDVIDTDGNVTAKAITTAGATTLVGNTAVTGTITASGNITSSGVLGGSSASVGNLTAIGVTLLGAANKSVVITSNDFQLNATKLTSTFAELNQLDLSTVGAVRKQKVISIAVPASDKNTEQSTGFTLPALCVVHGVYLAVDTAEVTGSAKTINVGTDSTDGGDADGFIAGLSTAATGVKMPTLTYNAVTLGAKLYVNTGDGANPVPQADVSQAGKEITFTLSDADAAEFEGRIIIDYTEITAAA